MKELSAALETFLDEPHVAILATLRRDGSPHQTAVWYLYEEGEIKISITEGRLKYKHVVRNPRVSVAIANHALPYKEVVFEGNAETTASGGAELFRRLAVRYYGETDGNAYADYDSRPGQERRLALRFRPDRVMAYDFAVEDDYHRPWGKGYEMSF